jgi:hypothetical protein
MMVAAAAQVKSHVLIGNIMPVYSGGRLRAPRRRILATSG